MKNVHDLDNTLLTFISTNSPEKVISKYLECKAALKNYNNIPRIMKLDAKCSLIAEKSAIRIICDILNNKVC